MFKNVASQRWIVFAFEDGGGTTPSAPVTGDAANITAKISQDGGAASGTNDTNPTEIEDGYYAFDLTQAETNADELLILPESGTANVQVIGVPGVVYTRPANFGDIGIETDGHVHADLKEWLGTTPLALSSQRVQTEVAAMASAVVTAAAIATDALGATELATDAVNEIRDAILDRVLSSNHDTADTPGAFLQNLDAAISSLNDPTAATIADSVWDEAVADHNTGGSFGQFLRIIKEGMFVREGTAQAGANGSITLDSGASATDDFYNHTLILLVGGTGAGQVRLITDYTGSTKVADVGRNWTTNPDNTSEFQVIVMAEIEAKSVIDRVTANTDQIEGSDATDQIRDAVVDDATRIDASQLNTASGAVGSDGSGLTEAGGTGDHLTALPESPADVTAISGDSTAADRLEALMDGLIVGQVNDASATTTAFAADGFTEATDDHLNGRLVTFITGALAGQQTDITDYDAAGGAQGSQEFTVSALTEAPADDDFFVIH